MKDEKNISDEKNIPDEEKLSVEEMNRRAEFWDMKIQELSLYAVSHGGTRKMSPEQVVDVFKEFKGYIRAGEFSYDELFYDVVSKFGILKPIPDLDEATHDPSAFGFGSIKGIKFPNLEVTDEEDQDRIDIQEDS